MKLTEISVARMVSARPEAVFDLWMDPSAEGGPWYGAARIVMDARVEGLYYFLVQHEGKSWAHYGRFLRLERPAGEQPGVAEYTWMSEATHGAESVVTVTFAPLGEEAEVTLRHASLPEDMALRHAQGWGWMLNLLAERFSATQQQ